MSEKTTEIRWTVEYSPTAKRKKKKLPKPIQFQVDLLAKEIELLGPIRKEWAHFSPLKKNKQIPENAYHCHVKSGPGSMSGNNFFRVRVRVPIVFRCSAFPIGTRTRTRTRTRSCHVTQKLYFLNHAKKW